MATQLTVQNFREWFPNLNIRTGGSVVYGYTVPNNAVVEFNGSIINNLNVNYPVISTLGITFPSAGVYTIYGGPHSYFLCDYNIALNIKFIYSDHTLVSSFTTFLSTATVTFQNGSPDFNTGNTGSYSGTLFTSATNVPIDSVDYGYTLVSGTIPDIGSGWPEVGGIRFSFTSPFSNFTLYSLTQASITALSGGITSLSGSTIGASVNNLVPSTSVTEVDAIATSFKVDTADLNTLFAGLSGLIARPTATGYKVKTSVDPAPVVYTDLSQLFAQLSDGTAASVTGFQVGGADLNTIFAARNSL